MHNFKQRSHSYGRKWNGSKTNARSFNQQSFSRSLKKQKQLDSNLFVRKTVQNTKAWQKPESNIQFSEYAISDKLKRNIKEHGYISPTPIQEKTIPHILALRDVIGIANTGTGKTAAFLIPLINKAYSDRNQRTLIITPTRELAMQILDEFTIFSKVLNLDAGLCIGGANIQRQEKNLHHHPHFVIGTPGRLKDLIKRQKLNLMLFQNIVLDEVDRMVDIGFIKDVQYLISLLAKKRQSLFFSATVSGKTQDILRQFVSNAVTVSVKQQETAENVEQDIIKVANRGIKIDTLHNLLIKEEFIKVLIFGKTKWGIEKLTKELILRGFKAASIHGNKSQGQRQRALAQFKQDELQILLATDVASRGLDIDNVTHVINYDTPASYEDYIHRIGRTGRAGKKGFALTFVE